MKVKITRRITLLLILILVCSTFVTYAEELSIEPNNVRRIYREKSVRYSKPGWPSHIYVTEGRFEGWLSEMGDYSDSYLGFLVTYGGYLYDPDLGGIPGPSYKKESIDLEQNKVNDDVLSSKKYIYHNVTYKQNERIPMTYYYSDGIYNGVLGYIEMWQNSDYGYTVTYGGYVYEDYKPIETYYK